MKDKIFNEFDSYWTPIFKRMYFKAKLLDEFATIIDIKENLYANWNLDEEQKDIIWNKIIGGKNDNKNNQNNH